MAGHGEARWAEAGHGTARLGKARRGKAWLGAAAPGGARRGWAGRGVAVGGSDVTDRPTRRIDRGRGHYYLLDGERADGVTWIRDSGVPKPGLIKWAAEQTAGYAIDRWDELADMKPSERLKKLTGARFETLERAGVRGTAVHKFALRLVAGEELEVPEELVGHVDAYLAFVREWAPEEILVEVPVFQRRYRYGGTVDLVARLADGLVWLLDWKTSAGGVYPESALQLAGYRYADFYLGADGEELPMPEVDRCGCVWLRADGYDLIPVEADEEAWRTFLYAQEVAHFTQEPRERFVGEAIRPPALEAVA
jgi:hypothetical protein